MSRLLMFLIRAYQRRISPLLGQRCRFHPTCSQYALDAVRINGPLVGAGQAAWRILRCGPWTKGGFDSVKPIGRRARARIHTAEGAQHG